MTVQSETVDIAALVRNSIAQNIPPEAKVTKVEFEGPIITIYAENPHVLLENNEIVKRIAREIKKRIVVRADPKARKPIEEAKKIIMEIVPPEAEITDIFFDSSIGEVIIQAKKPGLVIGKGGQTLKRIAYETGWRAQVERTPPLKSLLLPQLLSFQGRESNYRVRFLRSIGRRIHRPILYKNQYVTITALGGFREVGRSAILVRTPESNILLDCGVKPGAQGIVDEFPMLDLEVDIEKLDAVVVTHAHLDHCGLVPLLFKYGYNGPVYTTKPTKTLMTLLQLDYLDVAKREGKPIPYGTREVKKQVLHTIPLDYGEVTDIAPDVRLTLHNAGHILGSAIVHLHIGDGLYNIVYTGDFKYARTKLLEPAACSFPRVEALIIESTYGGSGDIMPSREETEQYFVDIVKKTLEKGGKVLIPVLAVGRAQEIMLVLDEAIKSGKLPKIPIYVEGLLQEVTAIHTAYPEELAKELRNKIFHANENPFLSDHFKQVDSKSARPDIVEGEPCIIMSTSGMLTGGPALEYFKLMASNPANSLIFVSYQIEGTLGRSLLKGVRQIPMEDARGKIEVIDVKMQIYSVDGFSGHSDRRQLLRFVGNMSPKPQVVIVNHGEESKSLSLANAIERHFHIETYVPKVGDRLRLK
ncbi:MAG: beta-CASP ribonuclease aCPSF1 [Candidatus Methanomethylicota archaeon]|uniref:Transcription termination factor FttA n=1 Tax=Thermoproteota archaeon TaxID=2056631 RepID=A0A497EUV8_9CREN|nr:MAG: beta-CASP ribonuclease aCPSF1 [Candidatus Verstraetearchaeota archaeon]